MLLQILCEIFSNTGICDGPCSTRKLLFFKQPVFIKLNFGGVEYTSFFDLHERRGVGGCVGVWGCICICVCLRGGHVFEKDV